MPQPQPLNILHVDDDDANRYVHTRMLQRAGFNVIEASTGLQALQLIAEIKPDLIVLDVKLPDIHGFEVCRRIKADPTTASIPVLHLSASFIQMEDKAEALEGGADGYLTQPVQSRELIATVNALLRMRQAEEIAISAATQWQTTFDSISDGICLLDKQNKVVRCNQAMAMILGKPEGEIIGCNCDQLWQNVGDETTGEFLGDRIHQSRICQSRELQISQRWYGVKTDPILDVKGDFTGTVQIFTDITDLKLAEAARTELLEREQAAREQAEANSHMKDEFLAIVSHELRSPLNAILGWARLLRTRKLEESVRSRAIETIERNALLQVQMIEDLLDISRIIRGTIRLVARPIQLKIPIEAAIETVLLAAQAKEISVITAFDPTMGMVLADSDRTQQVIWNLLSNAIKFTPPGGSIEVRLSAINSGACAQIQIIDTGCGISAEFLPHVFDRFRQADGSMTRSYSGLGLGLAIARQLVELHGGTLKAQSQGEGQGAIFTIELPLISNYVESTETQTKRTIGTINSNYLPVDDLPKLAGKLVLVVDDEEDNSEVLKVGLQEYNVKVITANSAMEAMEIVTKGSLDAIISDIGMPEMDGYQLIEQIRAWENGQGLTPILAIALTAYARDEDRQRAIACGFQMHLSKPIEPHKLALAISQLAGATALNK